MSIAEITALRDSAWWDLGAGLLCLGVACLGAAAIGYGCWLRRVGQEQRTRQIRQELARRFDLRR